MKLTTLNPRRGMVTPAIEEMMGRPLPTWELRLMPYIVHCAMNDGTVHAERINDQELKHLKALHKARMIIFKRKAGTLKDYTVAVTECYWNLITRIVWMGYAVKAVEDTAKF